MNNPLKVALLSISPHNRAILEFFFAGAGKKLFTTVATEQAEALIVDFDHPGARQEWQDVSAANLKPAIVLSVKETAEDNIVWVPKPLTSQALAGAAEKVRQLLPKAEAVSSSGMEPSLDESEHGSDIASLRALLDTQAQDARPFGFSKQQALARKAPPVKAPPPVQARKEALVKTTETTVAEQPADVSVSAADTEHYLRTEDVYIPPPLDEEEIEEAADSTFQLEDAGQADDPIRTEQRWNRLCGQEQQIAAGNWHESTSLYTPENYLLNSLVDALKLSHQSKQYVQIKIDSNEYALLMPDVNLAYCSIDLTSDQFAELCDTPLKSGRVQLHLPSTTELAALEETVQRHAEHTYDMESLIWTTSLLTSRGRLNRNADLNQPLRLKHWPNLTRLEQFPHVMQIAAAWQQRAGTVFDVSGWLDIPQRYVIAFYNASHTLSLFAVEQATPQLKEKTAPKKNRGLFSRLLKRLLGGGAK
ncbi:MAG: hypothetical protein ACPGSM_01065 [Thiolinea sp.]